MTLVLPPALAQIRDVVEPAMRCAVDTLDPAARALASYHLGWVDADGQPTTGGGKAVRPAFALLSAQAVRAPTSVAVPGAVAVELVHNFSLLHDDLMDGDVTRRHRATVWALHGPPAAILAGDALLALANQVLLDVGTTSAIRAASLLGRTTQELIRGQFEDVAFERRHDVTVDHFLAMVDGKTASLLSCAASIGAVLADASLDSVSALATYGSELGIAFQLVDDLLGIWGDPAVTGKAVGSDLRARKKSLPVTYSLCNGGPAGEALAEWLGDDGSVSDEEVARASELVEMGGGRSWAAEEARRRLARAEAALASADFDRDATRELVELGRFIVTREA